MILIGHYDSPFVRRVAVTLRVLGLPFERNLLSVFGDAEVMRRINPLGRIPSLQLDDGEVLVDSAAILDHLDEQVGSARALLPTSGPARRRALQLVVTAAGAIDKAGAITYERLLRPPAFAYEPWIERSKLQLVSALEALEAAVPAAGWLLGQKLTQADITASCLLAYLRYRQPEIGPLPRFAKLEGLSAKAEALPEFAMALPDLDEIGGPEAEARASLARLRGIA